MKAGIVTGIKSLVLLAGLMSHGLAAELDLADTPLNNSYAGPPNVMLLIDTSKSMDVIVAGSNEMRIDVARKVALNLVKENPKVRFGLTSLNGWHGGIIDCPIDTQCVEHSGFARESLLDRLDRYDENILTRGTPIAEAMYEVTRYFRGMKSFEYSIGAPTEGKGAPRVPYRLINYKRPVQHRCQKNYVIALTDGRPVRDDTFPAGDKVDKADDENESAALPNWDGSADDLPENDDRPNRLWYLDDIALFAWDLPDKIHTYTVGFAVDFPLLEVTAANGHGKYYTANTAEELSTVLKQAIDAIKAESLSSSAVAANTGRVQQGSRIYQARYNAEDWSGQLFAFDIITDSTAGDVGQLDTSASGIDGSVWEASNKIPSYDSRFIITNKNEKGIPFNWDEITESVLSDLFNGEDQLLYLRGKKAEGYRVRSSKLGDIVNSAPVYVGQPAARYPESIEETSYETFRKDNLTRTPMIYVGANDGMLHGFDAARGIEKLAYIPGKLLPKLKNLADTEYSHQYYVDGSPTVVDAFIGRQWRTILIGGLNAGGQSIYALDVTNPNDFNEGNADKIFLWEFTDKNDADLGYTFSKPAIVKMKDGSWYAVFGNGYNNTEVDGAASGTGEAVIFIVDLATGKLKTKISTGVGREQDPTGQKRPNGMATLTPVDSNGDSIADAIYGGDLFGNVWKVDLSKGVPQNESMASRLFTACAADQCNGAYQPQPITTQLAVNKIDGQIIVLFGTGKYIETTDANTDTAEVQSFYGIWDESKVFSGRKDLQQQKIIHEGTVIFTNKYGTVDQSDDEEITYVLRTTSDNEPDSNDKGWYIDLVTPVSGADADELGEQVIHRPVLRNGRVIFVTTTPSQESCGTEGNSWLMELDQETGGRPAINVFDLNKDGAFNSEDTVQDSEGNKIAVSGDQQSGSVASPTILDGDNGVEYKYLSGDAGIEVIRENSGGSSTGRQKWLQFNR